MRKPNNPTLSASLRRLRNSLRGLALACALLALTATAAAARPAPAGPAGDPIPPAPIVHVTTSTSGFDWGSAAIGAAGGLAISLIAIGGTLAATRRHAHHTGSRTS